MRADDDVDFAGFERGQGFLLLGGGAEAAEHFDARGKCGEAALEGFEVLKGEDGGGSEDGDLLGVGDGFEGGAHGDFGFAVADVAAEEAIHRRGAFHVALDVGDGEVLVWRFFEFEGVFKFALEVAVGRKREAWRRFFARRRGRGVGRPCLRAICGRGFCACSSRCRRVCRASDRAPSTTR